MSFVHACFALLRFVLRSVSSVVSFCLLCLALAKMFELVGVVLAQGLSLGFVNPSVKVVDGRPPLSLPALAEELHHLRCNQSIL